MVSFLLYYHNLNLSRKTSLESALAQAIQATFRQRRTAIPESLPLPLTAEFSNNPLKQAQWLAFLRKANLTADDNLSAITTFLAEFLVPPTQALAANHAFQMHWLKGGPWQHK